MSREIRFRIWDKKANAFWHNIPGFTNHGIVLNSEGNPGVVCDKEIPINKNDKNAFFFEQEFLTVQQFTGEVDKNGKEIWEGDILKYSNPERNGPVEWRSEVRDSFDWTGWRFGPTQYSGVETSEIIGNIFENPELVK